MSPEPRKNLEENLEENQEGTKKRPIAVRYSDDDVKTAEVMYSKILEKFPHVKQPKIQTWAESIRKMREIDMRAVQDIAATFTWANEHEFWQRNVLSPEGLRKHYDKIRAQMRPTIRKDDAFERVFG